DVDVLQSGSSAAEVIKDMFRSESEVRFMLLGKEHPDHIAVIYRLDLITANSASRGKDIDTPTFEQLAVEIQRGNTEVLNEVRFGFRQPQNGDQPCQVFGYNPRTGIVLFVRPFVNNEHVLGGELVDILAGDKSFQCLHIGPRDFQGLANVEDQVPLSVRQLPFRVNQLDDLYDHDHLLLHRQRLVDLPDDLHDLRPVVYELLGIGIKGVGFVVGGSVLSVNEIIEKLKVEFGSIAIEMETKKLLDIHALGLGDTLPRHDGKKLNDR